MFTKFWIRIFFLCSTFATNSAFACGPCEYSDSLGICWPYDKCVIPKVANQLNPITSVKNAISVAVAVASGDPKQITQAVGNSLIQSPACLGCASVAHTLLPNLSDAQINEAVGTGFLTFIGTGDPVLVTLSVATNIATQQPVKQPATAQTPGPSGRNPAIHASRTTQTYVAKAECLVTYKDGTAYAVWRDPATFTDTKGESHLYPTVDLVKNDIVTLTAPICPAWNNPTTGQLSVTSVSLKFEAVNSLTGDAKTLKWFVYGKSI